jgi:hypothetical protein
MLPQHKFYELSVIFQNDLFNILIFLPTVHYLIICILNHDYSDTIVDLTCRNEIFYYEKMNQ